MNPVETKIRDYCNDPEKQFQLLALLKVGRDKDQSAEAIARIVIGHILLDYHGLPLRENFLN